MCPRTTPECALLEIWLHRACNSSLQLMLMVLWVWLNPTLTPSSSCHLLISYCILKPIHLLEWIRWAEFSKEKFQGHLHFPWIIDPLEELLHSYIHVGVGTVFAHFHMSVKRINLDTNRPQQSLTMNMNHSIREAPKLLQKSFLQQLKAICVNKPF